MLSNFFDNVLQRGQKFTESRYVIYEQPLREKSSLLLKYMQQLKLTTHHDDHNIWHCITSIAVTDNKYNSFVKWNDWGSERKKTQYIFFTMKDLNISLVYFSTIYIGTLEMFEGLLISFSDLLNFTSQKGIYSPPPPIYTQRLTKPSCFADCSRTWRQRLVHE